MSDNLTTLLLSLAIACGSCWLAIDFSRQRSPWFAWFFALLAFERVTAVSAVPDSYLLSGLAIAGAGQGAQLFLMLILARLVVGRFLYLVARKRNLVVGSAGERRC